MGAMNPSDQSQIKQPVGGGGQELVSLHREVPRTQQDPNLALGLLLQISSGCPPGCGPSHRR